MYFWACHTCQPTPTGYRVIRGQSANYTQSPDDIKLNYYFKNTWCDLKKFPSAWYVKNVYKTTGDIHKYNFSGICRVWKTNLFVQFFIVLIWATSSKLTFFIYLQNYFYPVVKRVKKWKGNFRYLLKIR